MGAEEKREAVRRLRRPVAYHIHKQLSHGSWRSCGKLFSNGYRRRNSILFGEWKGYPDAAFLAARWGAPATYFIWVVDRATGELHGSMTIHAEEADAPPGGA